MSKKRVSFGPSEGESSRKSGSKKSKSIEEEVSSKGARLHKLSSKERDLLRDDKARDRYSTFFANREVELGKVVDFQWLANENHVDIDLWLNTVGWNEFVQVEEPVYPKLVRILYANLNPETMTSWIGNIAVRLDVDAWCSTFNIPNLTQFEEEPVRNLPKEELFRDLFGKEGLGIRSWVNSNTLPTDATIRLATNILMNVLIPKKGSKEQLKEEEGRILYTLKHGKDLNLARDIVERIKLSTIRKSTPLCYGMHLMVLMKRVGVNVKSAGDSEPMQVKDSSHINMRTLGRLGFKKDFQHWNYLGRGHVKSSTSHMHRTLDEEESHRRGFREGGADHHFDEAAEESAAPDQSAAPQGSPRPRDHSTSTIPSTPHLARQITNLQTSLSSQITNLQTSLSNQIANIQTSFNNQVAHLTSHICEKFDYLTATVNSRLDTMNSNIDDLSLRVKSCETLLQPSQPPPPKSKPRQAPKPKTRHAPQPKSTPTPPPKSILKPTPTPTQKPPPQSSPEPPHRSTQDPSPIPIPDSPPPTVHPSQTPIPSPRPSDHSGSPLFSIDELLSSSFLQPTLSTQPLQPSPQPSERSLALQLVRDTLNVPKTPRTKRTVSKTYHRQHPK